MINQMFRALSALLLSCASPCVARAPAAAVFEQGMVSAADPRAAEAGAEILRAGGSAADAAIAVIAALTVVEPQSSGIGGGGFMLLDDGKGVVSSIDGRETAPSAAHPEWFFKEGKALTMAEAVPGGLSVGVPGNVALMAEAHKRHGKLKWRALFTPAIRLARQGFAISPRSHEFLQRAKGRAGFSAEGRALFFGADGNPLPAGTVVKNPALADFLEQLGKNGPRAFYSGDNAKAIVRAVAQAERTPAPLTLKDIARYRAKWREPVCAPYRGWKLCGMGPPSSGATTVLGTLGLLEKHDLAALGKDSATSWHLMAEAMRLAYADRDRWLADSDFVDVPVAGLLAPAYLAERARLIAPDRTERDVTAGTPPGAKLVMADAQVRDIPSTSHFAVMDRMGMAVSMTSTVEGPYGSGLMVSGYYLNNELTDFSMAPSVAGRMVANRVEAGKRPLSSMAPTLAYSPDGKLRLVIGAAGGRTIPAQVIKALVGVIDWGLSAQDAVALPQIYQPGGRTVIIEQGSALEAMIPALKALGHDEIRTSGLPLKANALEVLQGKITGAADPRSEGRAVAE